MKRCCALPKEMKNLCEMGCVYREKAFRHLSCAHAMAVKAPCVSPCIESICTCRTRKTEIPIVDKEPHEVLKLQ